MADRSDVYFVALKAAFTKALARDRAADVKGDSVRGVATSVDGSVSLTKITGEHIVAALCKPHAKVNAGAVR